jgi:hypothetical protein
MILRIEVAHSRSVDKLPAVFFSGPAKLVWGSAVERGDMWYNKLVLGPELYGKLSGCLSLCVLL